LGHVANIVVSNACGMSCPFCFARDELLVRGAAEGRGAGPAPAFISLPEFEERLDFLDRSGIDEARLIGGEPTIHPRFPELIRRARSRGKRIVVFSHGLMPESSLNCLAELPPDECTVIVNASATRSPGGPTEEEETVRRDALAYLGPRALLGLTIDRGDFRIDHLLPLIVETGCRKRIRLGLSQPAASGLNSHLNPKQYPAIGRRIAGFAREAAGAGVSLSFDCGFVRCMFSDSEISDLRAAGADLEWRCSPVLDVDLSGQAFHCFPLAGRLQTRVDPTANAAEMRAALAHSARSHRLAGIYRECSSCSTRAGGGCSGGCLAVTMRRFRRHRSGDVAAV
jgi:hypothetical protein